MRIIDGVEVSEALFKHAMEVFEDEGSVIDYLRSTPLALEGKSPLQYIKEGNEKEIDRELTRIDHGIY